MYSFKKVLTIGWDINLIFGILHKVEEKSDIRFHNFVYEDVYHKVNTSDRKDYSKIPNQKEVEFETIDKSNILIIKVYYKNVFQFEVKLITSKGLCEIVEIK